MRLNAPTKLIWNICLILAIVSVVFFFLPYFNVILFTYQGLVGYILMLVAYVLLMLATFMKGM